MKTLALLEVLFAQADNAGRIYWVAGIVVFLAIVFVLVKFARRIF